MPKTTSKQDIKSIFKKGELAVYPAHGVGVIEDIMNKNVLGTEKTFYVLKVLDSEATILVPVDNASSVGLRRVVKKTMVPKVYNILKEKKDLDTDNQTWNKRYREYTEKIKSGCVMEVAKVLRDLYLLKEDKELSFGERKMLDTAKNLLVREIAVAKNAKQEKIEEELNRLMES